MKISRASVGAAVRTAREAAQMTAADLATLTDISPSAISRTEAGLRDLHFAEATAVAHVLGLSIDAFMDLAATFERDASRRSETETAGLEQDLVLLQRLAAQTAVENRAGANPESHKIGK